MVRKINKPLILINCAILVVLGIAIYSLSKQLPVTEGITNMNCCGGIIVGTHYQESDTEPPEYVRRCFTSDRADDGSVRYDWHGFPCSTAGSEECCPGLVGSDDSPAQCIPTNKGGYCKVQGRPDKIFRRGNQQSSPYIKLTDERILDINDTNEMSDYFFDQSQNENLSPEMREFMDRRARNNDYIQQHIVDTNRERLLRITRARGEAEKDKKFDQIKSSLTALVLIFTICFALVIRELIIRDIDQFYDLLATKLAEFKGNSV